MTWRGGGLTLTGYTQVNDREPPVLTLSQAAKECGKSKTAIHKALTRGRISAKKNDKGEWEIDPAELFRVYSPVNGKSMDKLTIENGGLTHELEALRKENVLLQETLSDVREDRDHWRNHAQSTQKLLQDMRPKTTATRQTLWQWLGFS